MLAAAFALAAMPGNAHEQAASGSYRVAADALVESAKFRVARASIASNYERIVADTVTLTQIPAPPFGEARRGEAYRVMLAEHGLADVQSDAVGNVFGFRAGMGGGKLVVVSAHLDTVFPAGTPVTVTRRGDKLYAPGIADNTASLAVLLAFMRAMDAAKFETRHDIVFVASVGEEGAGNLRGVRHLFAQSPWKDRIAAFVAFEPDRAGAITNGGVGSRRYEVTFRGPGGHSYEAFGLVNPAYAMADAIARIGRMALPANPKTTINVGLLSGGTSVNSIPRETAMTVDMRSVDTAALTRAEAAFNAAIVAAVAMENAARSIKAGPITFVAKLIGDRPVGNTRKNTPIVQTAAAAAEAFGVTPGYFASSTDANLPMSRGVPAITLGAGFESARHHSLEEELTLNRSSDIEHMAVGLTTILLLADAR